MLKGLGDWQSRLASSRGSTAIEAALRREAEALAAEARAAAPSELDSAIDVADESRGTKLAFRIGTADPRGRVLEFGTLRLPAAPWLLPAFRGRVARIKDVLRKVATTG
jgi:hypothetical protein